MEIEKDWFLMACLETDFLISLIRKDPEAIKKFIELEKRNELLAVTPIAASELFYGAAKSKRADENAKVESVLSLLDLLYFDLISARKCGELMAYFDNAGLIGDLDTLTAGICIAHEEKIITRNTKHYSKVRNLKVETY